MQKGNIMEYITRTFTYNGKRIYVRGKTEREVADKIAEKKLLLKTKKAVVASDITTDEWFEIYIKTYKIGIEDKTIADYRGVYNNNIKPFVGPLKLTTITPMTCQTILNSVAGKSNSYIKKTYILYKSMLDKALANKLIVESPLINVVIPKGTEGKRRPLTDKEREIFIRASETDSPAFLFCKIMFYCGLRPSEVMRIEGGDYKDGRLYVRGTKTPASTRVVPIPSQLTLPKLKKGQLLFTTKNGNPIDKKKTELYWAEVKRALNKEIDTPELTLYCLRHDYCTRLEEAGVPINVACRLMGHSDISVTAKIYTHESETAFQNASKLINNFNQKVQQ